MPFYLSEYTGAGTRVDPFVPVGADQPGWSAIDLRPDPSRVDGGGLSACLLRVPVAFTDVRARFLADDKLESLTNPQKNFLQNKLGVDLSSPTLLRDIIATLLNSPPVNGWKPLRPGLLRWEIWLGELIWEAPRASGGATDDFNRANETPLASPWVNSASANDVDQQAALASNAVQTTGYGISYYTSAASSGDQYSEAVCKLRDSGAGVRLAVGTTAFNGYVNGAFGGTETIAKVTNGSTSTTVQTGGAVSNAQHTFRLEVSGSTLTPYVDGVVSGSPATDTTYTTGQPGISVSTAATHAVDSWLGGDLAGTPQTLRPDADTTTTGWTTTPLWSKIEEVSADGTVITATAS